jgi:hypothetical protein
LKTTGQQRCQAPIFQKAAVETVQEKQGLTLSQNRYRKGIFNA